MKFRTGKRYLGTKETILFGYLIERGLSFTEGCSFSIILDKIFVYVCKQPPRLEL